MAFEINNIHRRPVFRRFPLAGKSARRAEKEPEKPASGAASAFTGLCRGPRRPGAGRLSQPPWQRRTNVWRETASSARGVPATDRLTMSWHHPNLYLVLGLLTGFAAFLAILYEGIRKFRRRPIGLKKAKPLDGLLRDHPSQLIDPPVPHGAASDSSRWRYAKDRRGPSPNFRSWPAKKSTATMRHEFYLSPKWLNSR